jgi:hypothetical protein
MKTRLLTPRRLGIGALLLVASTAGFAAAAGPAVTDALCVLVTNDPSLWMASKDACVLDLVGHYE